MALLVWQFFAYSDVLDPYILSVGLGTVSNLCRLWAIVRFQSHLRSIMRLVLVGFLYSVRKSFISVASLTYP